MVDQSAVYHLTKIREHVKALIDEFEMGSLEVVGGIARMVVDLKGAKTRSFIIIMSDEKFLGATLNCSNNAALEYLLKPVVEAFEVGKMREGESHNVQYEN